MKRVLFIAVAAVCGVLIMVGSSGCATKRVGVSRFRKKPKPRSKIYVTAPAPKKPKGTPTPKLKSPFGNLSSGGNVRRMGE